MLCKGVSVKKKVGFLDVLFTETTNDMHANIFFESQSSVDKDGIDVF
jgi:hypothetical protein